MNLRSVLNGIAALAAVGVFYTFALCMVDNVNDAQISQEYYYNTATETEAAVETDVIETTAETVNKITKAGYNKEKADIPQLNDNLRINSKMEKSQGYMAAPDSDEPLVITPIFSGLIERAEEPAVTSVPAYAEETEAVTEIAAADIQPEPAAEEETAVSELDFDDVPEDMEDELISVDDASEAAVYTVNASESYINALHFNNFQADDTPDDIRKKMEELEREFTEQHIAEETTAAVTTVESAPLVTVAPEDITLPITYFDTTSYSGDTGAAVIGESGEIFTAKVGGEVQDFDAYELVCMIVSTEMSPSFSPEALKAQAVAAYSYVKYHNVNGLVPSVLVKTEIPQEVTDAVNAVWGKCCYYNGRVAQTLYTASSAGASASAVNIWGGNDVPYLRSVDTSFDALFDPNYGYVASYSEDYMRNAIESALGITLSDNPENWLVVTNRVDGPYVSGVSIDGQMNVSGMKIREKVLKYQLKSWAFDVSYSDGEFTFVTYGYGHGAGMSQNGANYLGRQGYTYDQILSFYFPGITIE